MVDDIWRDTLTETRSLNVVRHRAARGGIAALYICGEVTALTIRRHHETRVGRYRPAHTAHHDGYASDAALTEASSGGGKRADGAAEGRQMQATPGHSRSLQDTRKHILSGGDSP